MCTECGDYCNAQSLLGMVFMRRFTEANGEYVDGDLDPGHGKIYRCKIRLKSGSRSPAAVAHRCD